MFLFLAIAAALGAGAAFPIMTIIFGKCNAFSPLPFSNVDKHRTIDWQHRIGERHYYPTSAR